MSTSNDNWNDDIEAPRCKDCGDYHYGPCPSDQPSGDV